MKHLTAILLVAMLALGTPAFAGKKGKKKGKDGGGNFSAAIVKQFDKNGNHQIDADEVAALKSAFAAAPPGAGPKKLDRNSNGVLDDDEITAVNARAQGAAGAGGKKKKKNKQ
jgi:hypothetical protein